VRVARTIVRMNPPDFETFSRQARAEGFDEVVERHWDPLKELATHTHPFAAKALVTQGQMWLMVNGQTQALQSGDWFELDRDVPHEERYGAEGTTLWVARRY
jgi:AraC-like ligand binding domain